MASTPTDPQTGTNASKTLNARRRGAKVVTNTLLAQIATSSRRRGPTARFPFEEDPRFRFGAFHELVHRYIFIGREPPAERRPQARPARSRRSTQRSGPPGLRPRSDRDAMVVHANPGGAP